MEIVEELDTLRQKLAHLALKYTKEYPDLLQNYTLAMLLYVHEYELGVTLPRRRDLSVLSALIRRAKQGTLVNFTSLHRAITATKRDFQDPEQRRKALILQEDWGEALRVAWKEAP